MANERALEREATKAGKDRDTLLKEEVEKRASVTDEEVQKYYDEHKDRFRNLPFEKVSPAVKRQLLAQKQVAAMQEYIEEPARDARLREQARAAALRDRSGSGPTQGPADAPITLVEFSDYECPFCKAAEAVVKQVLERYPTQVKLVFKNYPLPTHPKARPAAEAALCAAEQGKFWEFHAEALREGAADRPEQLARIATEAGLDTAKFEECITAKRSSAQIDADLEAGKKRRRRRHAGVLRERRADLGRPHGGRVRQGDRRRAGAPRPSGSPAAREARSDRAGADAGSAGRRAAGTDGTAGACGTVCAAPRPAAPNAAPAAPPTAAPAPADDGHGH